MSTRPIPRTEKAARSLVADSNANSNRVAKDFEEVAERVFRDDSPGESLFAVLEARGADAAEARVEQGALGEEELGEEAA